MPSNAALLDQPDLQVLASTLLGDFVMPNNARMHFPVPMFGLPQHRDYALLPARRKGLWWLQSTTDDALTFILADPFVLDEQYGIDLGDVERDMLQVTAADDAFTLVMITLPSGNDAPATANFRAPIVFNLRAQRAMQVVARDESYALRTPVDISTFPPQAEGLRMVG